MRIGVLSVRLRFGFDLVAGGNVRVSGAVFGWGEPEDVTGLTFLW